MNQKRSRTLKDYRRKHKLNQRAAAKRFGLSQASWSRYERGEHRPNRVMAKKLMDATGVPFEVLMGMAS